MCKKFTLPNTSKTEKMERKELIELLERNYKNRRDSEREKRGLILAFHPNATIFKIFIYSADL